MRLRQRGVDARADLDVRRRARACNPLQQVAAARRQQKRAEAQ
jgi:hypothetical protein